MLTIMLYWWRKEVFPRLQVCKRAEKINNLPENMMLDFWRNAPKKTLLF